MAKLKILQANIQHCAAASAALQINITLIQEPWVNKSIKGLHTKGAALICDHNVCNPRSAVLVDKRVSYIPLNNHISKDLVAIMIHVSLEGSRNDVVIDSAMTPANLLPLKSKI